MARFNLLAAGIVLLACSDGGTGPTPLQGTYPLVAENDQPLPSERPVRLLPHPERVSDPDGRDLRSPHVPPQQEQRDRLR